MKKSNLFLVLLTALIVMSCSKDETSMSIPQEGNAIEFGTYVGRDAQTRGTVIDDSNLPTLGFGVFAYYTDNDVYKTTSTPNFMYNTKVSTAGWTYSPVKYWPNEANDKLTFFAYAPYSNGSQNNISDFTANTAAGDPTLLFTVNGTTKSQSDLLYADATSLKNLGKQTIGGKVNFPFKHALSRIGFKVEVMVDKVNDDPTGTPDDGTETSVGIAAGTVVSVQKVELIGAFTNSNTFNFAAGTWGASPTVVTTTDPAYSLESTNFESAVAEAVTISPQVLNTTDSYLMIIPKVFTKTTAQGDAPAGTDVPLQIRVTYKVTTTDGALSGNQSEITNVITSEPFGFTFEAGKAYSFNLHLGLTSVKFSATVTGWDVTADDIVVNVPINTAP